MVASSLVIPYQLLSEQPQLATVPVIGVVGMQLAMNICVPYQSLCSTSRLVWHS